MFKTLHIFTHRRFWQRKVSQVKVFFLYLLTTSIHTFRHG